MHMNKLKQTMFTDNDYIEEDDVLKKLFGGGGLVDDRQTPLNTLDYRSRNENVQFRKDEDAPSHTHTHT